ncbi:MAG: hypothetical protein GY903_05715 [Fuerstiella sp.]|nr:hypothetical protein [Fuerstiella sp.]MCP4853970.1 hypothetical protein [Fuerstiella sp.]
MSPDLVNLLKQQNARISEAPDGRIAIDHFGDVEQEIDALHESAVVCPLPDHICVRGTGQDRAKFLHNFCTNNVNDLESGQFCEAFFCDLNAKVIAHGYVLAGDEAHEIGMLPGDAEVLLNHLNRYIITEDVILTAPSAERTTFAVAGPQTESVLSTLGNSERFPDAGCCIRGNVTMLLTTWNELPTAFVSVSNGAAVQTWTQLTTVATAAGDSTFHHLRILEGFPVIGTDLTGDNLAPEADRNSMAISYNKGCYLGQEPIARLDAMGHVNRKLYKGWATIAANAQDSEELPIVTSRSMSAGASFPVLLPLSVKLAANSDPLIAKIKGGPTVQVDRLV